MKFLVIMLTFASTQLWAGCEVGRKGKSATCNCGNSDYSFEINSQSVRNLKNFIDACKEGDEYKIKSIIEK